MRIYIGSEELNFEMQQTLPFAEVLQKLTAWAESQKLFILDYRVAAKPEFAAQAELNSDEIDVIELELGDQRDLIESNLRELIDYTDRVGLHLAQVIQEGRTLGENAARDIKVGAVFIAESLDALGKYLAPENAEYLAKAINALNTQDDLLEKINALGAVQNQLKLWLRHTAFARVTPAEAIEKVKTFRDQIPVLQSDLEQIAARFTQGREQEALAKLETVSQTLVDAVILMRIAGDAKKQQTEKLVTLLGDLTQAVDSRDLVTAADIADFDLRDALKDIA
jgi:DNA-binding LytR/AlgR family response regulator